MIYTLIAVVQVIGHSTTSFIILQKEAFCKRNIYTVVTYILSKGRTAAYHISISQKVVEIWLLLCFGHRSEAFEHSFTKI